MKERLLYCCNQAWIKMVGWFHWMLLLSVRCSRPPGRRENTLWKAIRRTVYKAQSFRLVQWLNTIRFLQETSQGSTNLVRKFYLEYSSDMCRTLYDCGQRRWRDENLDSSEIHPRILNAKEVLSPQKEDTFKCGRIPWSVTAICETFRISCLMGRHHTKGGSECPLTDQWYRLEQWSHIALFLPCYLLFLSTSYF